MAPAAIAVHELSAIRRDSAPVDVRNSDFVNRCQVRETPESHAESVIEQRRKLLPVR